MALFIGVDLGSSSVKCAAVDHLGGVKAQAEVGYDFDSPREGWLEVHPDGRRTKYRRPAGQRHWFVRRNDDGGYA